MRDTQAVSDISSSSSQKQVSDFTHEGAQVISRLYKERPWEE